MRLGLGVWASVMLAGCAAASDLGADTDDFIDMPTPPGNCSAETGSDPCPSVDDTGNPGQPVGGPCLDPDDCQFGLGCVAPFEDGEIGEFTCTDQCIALEDETAWCMSGAACCDSAAVCRRGLCVIDQGSDSSTGDSGSGSGSDGSSDGSSDSGSGTGGSGSGGSGSTGMQ